MVHPIDNSTKEERRAYVHEAWKCLHNCELMEQREDTQVYLDYPESRQKKTKGQTCGKCRILKGRDAEVLYADYIEGKRSYMNVALEIRNRSLR